MNQQTVPNITLFDLLARNWRRTSAVADLCFNDDQTLLAAACEDGSVVIARLADNEPPEGRIKVDNGQTTIHPREGKPSPLIITRIKGAGAVRAGHDGGFLATNDKGSLVRISRAGEIAETVFAADTPVLAFDHCQATGLTAIVAGGQVHLRTSGASSTVETELAGNAACVALLHDGTMLALAGGARLGLYRCGDNLKPVLQVALPTETTKLTWSEDGQWLACGLGAAGLCLVDVGSGRHVMLGEFPGPVHSLDWSAHANALFAAGAYRIAGWSMAAPPFENSASGALATGRPGLVMVDAVAAQPKGRLVAAGYGNGQIVVAPAGSPEELVVRQAGGRVSALRWSADGRHLAMGDADGNIAIITFPKELFK